MASSIFVVNFEYISYLVLVFLLLTLNMQLSAGFFQVSLQISRLLKFDVTRKSLNIWLNMSYLLFLMCMSDIQYVKIVRRTSVEMY